MDALDPKDLQPQTMLGMKLIQQPFSKMPDAEKLFDFDALKETRDTVSHHLQFSHLLMVIQGRDGSGKDSFANSLIVGEHPALYFFNATAESDDNLQSILSKAAQNNHADTIQILEKRIQDIMYRGQQPVIIVNNAEQLSETELKNIIEYTQQKTDSNQQTKLKLLLLGKPNLEKNLERNGIINHNQFYLIALPQLNVSNTRGFLMHRLTLAGFRDAGPFFDKDITDIFSMANGNPTATMEYAAECLNKNKSLYEENVSEKSKATKPLLIVGTSLFIAAIIYNSILSSDDKTSDVDTNIETISETKNIEKKAVDQLFNASTNTMDVKKKKPNAVLPKLTSDYVLPAFSQQSTIPLNAELLESAQSTTGIIPKDSSTLLAEKMVAMPSSVSEKNSQPVTNTSVNPAKVTPPSSVIKKPVEKTEHKTESKELIQKPQIKPVIEKVDKTSQAFIKAKAKSSNWLLKQPTNNWSLQILAGHEAETLLNYIHLHQLGDKVAYFRSRLNKKDWHVILYGQYKSKEQAKAVIPYLPKYIQQNKPWAKDMKSVQSSIKQYQ